MKIQRAREDSNFTILGNDFIDDRRLSVLAAGLGMILLRMPPDASVTLAGIAANRKEGLKTLRKAATELEEAGYLVRVIERGEGGMFTTLTEMHSRPVSPEDRPESLPKPWSKAKDVSAGRTESPSRNFGERNSGEPNFGEPHSSISTSLISTGMGEDRDARAREQQPPSDHDEPRWGATGQRSYAGPSLLAADLIRDIATRTLMAGEGLSNDDHVELAAMLDAARPVVDSTAGVTWEDLTTWLGEDLLYPDGRPKFKTLPGVLRWRLRPEQIQRELRQWVYARNAAQADSGPQGQREGAPAPSPGACGVHKTRLDDQGLCLPCEDENRRAADTPPAAPPAPSGSTDTPRPQQSDHVRQIADEARRQLKALQTQT